MAKRYLFALILSLLGLVANAKELSIVYLGDSNLWIGGMSCENSRGWSYWLQQMLPDAKGKCYARSGATWTNTSSTNPIPGYYSELLDNQNVMYNQILELVGNYDMRRIEAPDIIMLSAGTNDAWFKDKRPGIFDVSVATAVSEIEVLRELSPDRVTSLAESVVYGVDLLQSTFPKSAIVLLTPPETTAASTEMINKVGNIIEKCGTAMHVSMVIRLDKLSGISRAMEKQKPSLTTDGTHTSEEGAKRIAKIVFDKLKAKSLLNN